MNKEELENAFNETTDNAVNLLKENVELKNRIDKAIEKIYDIRQSTFSKYNSNEWNNCLSFNDDILPLLNILNGEDKE